MEEVIFYEGRGQVPAGVIIKDGLWAILGILLLVGSSYLPAKLLDLDFDFSTIWLWVALAPIFVGILLITYHQILYKNARFKITNMKIQREKGILLKKTELIELYKITDLGLSEFLGRGTIKIHSTDNTSPQVTISIPAARKIFQELQEALPAARDRSNVAMRLDIS